MISFKSIKAGFEFQNPAFFRSWLKNVLSKEGRYVAGEIQYIFCDDEYLLQINRKYLKHDTLTDIITFSNSENDAIISGDIFISIDRLNENQINFATTKHEELSRVIVHGLLHLIDYNDQTIEEKNIMTQKEDYYLSLQPKNIT